MYLKVLYLKNNVRLAKLNVLTYLSRWTDNDSEIGSVPKRVPYRSSVWVAELKDSSCVYNLGLRLYVAW